MSIQDLYRTSGLGPVTGPSKGEAVGKARGLNQDGKLDKPNEFRELLQKEQSKVNLSAHAETRIKSREIPWSEAIEKRISHGMDQANAKGSREALILADDVAVIANVKSRTVVTAMDRNQMKDRIFTNIDSAVLV